MINTIIVIIIKLPISLSVLLHYQLRGQSSSSASDPLRHNSHRQPYDLPKVIVVHIFKGTADLSGKLGSPEHQLKHIPECFTTLWIEPSTISIELINAAQKLLLHPEENNLIDK